MMDIKTLHKLFLQSAGVTTDTRKVQPGQLFFALRGENFNGNQYADQALDKGATYAVIDDASYKPARNFILVSDVLRCLQDLASYHRQYLQIPVIAITGTNGKTTSKELIREVLGAKYEVVSTYGNLNNHIGVPLTLLSLKQTTEIGVVEMGANHLNEIEGLCKIALPDFGVITNIGKAHLEGFGSFQGVINAKSELYNYLRENNKKVFINAEDELLMKQSEGIEKIKYGKSDSNFCSAQIIDASPYLSIKWKNLILESKLVGEYNFNNLLLAICIGSYFKIDDRSIAKAISEYNPENNRSQLKQTEHNTLIIDAYNANPSSMELSVLNFFKIKSDEKLLMLGDMFELGDSSESEHKKILNLISENGFRNVFLIGKNFFGLKSINLKYTYFEDVDQLINFLTNKKIKGKTILLKASRGIQLEKVIPFL